MSTSEKDGGAEGGTRTGGKGEKKFVASSPRRLQTALYRRVSTDDQEASMNAMEERMRAYLITEGLTEDMSFQDSDTSGTVPLKDRTGGGMLWSAIQDGRVGHVVVAKPDRLSRSIGDLDWFAKECDRRGVTIHFVDFGGKSLSTGGPIGKLVLAMLGAFAEFEVAMIRSRTREALASKRANGRLSGKVPYGKQLIGEYGSPDARVVDHPEELAVLRDMIQWHYIEGIGVTRIAGILNRKDVPTKTPKGTTVNLGGGRLVSSDGRWKPSSVEHILTSRHAAEVAQSMGIEVKERTS